MKYRIEYTDRRCCRFANSSKELITKLREHKPGEIEDVRKVYKGGSRTDSVLDVYRQYIQ